MGHAVDDLHRVGIKLFATDETRIEPRELVPVFHQWIQAHAIDHLMIDVADYTHLHEGPSVVLVAHEGNLALDCGGGRMGLLYTRKQPVAGPLPSRLMTICRIIVGAGILLESDRTLEERLHLRGDELEVIANDRLLAPPSEDAFDRLHEALEPLLTRLYRTIPWTITHTTDPRVRLTLAVNAAHPTSLTTLADRLE